MRWLLIVVLLSIAGIGRAESPAASKFCTSLDEETARSSTECLRWYFACRLSFPSGPSKPPYNRLSAEERYQISMKAILRIAETSCEHFSYAEAWAAMQAKSLPKPPVSDR